MQRHGAAMENQTVACTLSQAAPCLRAKHSSSKNLGLIQYRKIEVVYDALIGIMLDTGFLHSRMNRRVRFFPNHAISIPQQNSNTVSLNDVD